MPNSNSTTNKETLWVISELYYPEETSTGYYLTKIAEGLSKDFDVNVICGQPNYSAKGTTASKFEKYKNVNINRVFGTRLDKNVIFFRLINMFTLSLSIFLKGFIKIKKNEKVLVVTTPPLLPFITGFVAKIKKAKHILLIHDNYPEILIAVNKTKEKSYFTRLLNYFNGKLYENSFKIIVVGRDMKKLVSKKLKVKDEQKLFVIPNWAETEDLSPTDKEDNVLLEQLGLKEKLVFLYAGNMGYPNDLESFVQVAEKLKTDSRYHFIFLGTGVKKSYLISKVRENELDNITILDPKPRSEQQLFLNACDVAIVSLIKKMWGVSMPSRTYNILAVGKPILALCETKSELDLVVTEESVGWSIQPDNPELLLKTIEEINEKKYMLAEMKSRARRVALEKYSLKTAISKYRKALM